jgi:hypothetical protein
MIKSLKNLLDKFSRFTNSLVYDGGICKRLYNINESKQNIANKLLSEYFLHHIASINKNSPIQINYQNLTSGLIKNKKLILKESYKTNEATSIVTFKILINSEEKVVLQGKSIKTLRKKAFKEIFFHLLDNHY